MCHCVGYNHIFYGLSNPLIVCVGGVKDIDKIGIILIHELLHIKHREDKTYRKYTKYMQSKYNFEPTVISHIALFTTLYFVCKEVGLIKEFEESKKSGYHGVHIQTRDFIDKHGYDHIWELYNNVNSAKI